MPTPATLAAAILERLNDEPALAWIDGGFYAGNAPDFSPDGQGNLPKYYVAFFLIAEGDDRRTGAGYAKRQVYQFDAYAAADAPQSCEEVLDAVVDLFNPVALIADPLVFARGSTITAVPRSAADDPIEYDRQGGGKLRRRHRDVMFRVNRSS